MSDDPYVIPPEGKIRKTWSRLSGRLDSFLATGSLGVSPPLRSPALLGNSWFQRVKKLQPDIIHLHWICGGFIRLESLSRLAEFPVIWTLHDSWPFSGLFHFLPDPSEDSSGETLTQGFWTRQMDAFTRRRKTSTYAKLSRMEVVGVSQDMTDRARRSSLFEKRDVSTILNVPDENQFRPIDRAVARNILNIHHEKPVILFGACNPLDERKGADLLFAALKSLKEKTLQQEPEIWIFGCSEPDSPPHLPFPVRYWGLISDDTKLQLLYSAADIMTVPSRQEGLCLIALQALSCAIPVVAFSISSMPEIVRHGENGYLAKAFSTEDLADGLEWCLESAERRLSLGAAARKLIEEKFSLAHQYRAHMNLYQELIARKPNGGFRAS